MAKYKKEYAEKLPEMFANGEDVSEVCVKLGISRRAFYDWIGKYPEFAEAYEKGKLASESWWTKLGRAGAAGEVDIQPTVWIFNMKNKFNWRDKQDVDQKVTGTHKHTVEVSSVDKFADILKDYEPDQQ